MIRVWSVVPPAHRRGEASGLSSPVFRSQFRVMQVLTCRRPACSLSHRPFVSALRRVCFGAKFQPSPAAQQSPSCWRCHPAVVRIRTQLNAHRPSIRSRPSHTEVEGLVWGAAVALSVESPAISDPRPARARRQAGCQRACSAPALGCGGLPHTACDVGPVVVSGCSRAWFACGGGCLGPRALARVRAGSVASPGWTVWRQRLTVRLEASRSAGGRRPSVFIIRGACGCSRVNQFTSFTATSVRQRKHHACESDRPVVEARRALS